jgi:glycosyltransferase involved in cell wall biosynthesis
MKSIRVLQIIDRLNVGGPAYLVSVLADRLDPSRFEQSLLACSIDPSEGDYIALRAPDMPVARVRGLGRAPRPSDDARAFAEISATIRRFRPHIVHTHKAKAGALGRPAAWLHRVPATVHTFHGHLLHSYFSRPKTRALVAAESLLARPTSSLISIGERVRDELVAAGIGRPEQYTVVAPGVDLGHLPEPVAARRALGLPPHAPTVMFVGRLTAVKRPDRFVDMALELARSDTHTQFAVAGDGDLAHSVRARAKPLGERMSFLGWRGDIHNVYAASDVVVLTSDNEGMPVSLIETAASGRPAVTTDVGSAREVVVDGVTGYVTPKDACALARAVDKLLSEETLRASMGGAAATRAKEHFGADRLASEISTLYETLAATHPRRVQR